MTTNWAVTTVSLGIYLSILAPMLGTTASTRGPYYSDECSVWQQLDTQLEQEDNMDIICEQNPLCTGIDCTGHYKYTGVLSAFQQFDIDTCTGLSLRPCTDPLQVYVYIELPDRSVNFSRNFDHTERVAIPGATIDAGNLGKIDPFLQVDINETRIGGKRYVLLGVQMKVRISIAGTWEEWPADMQVTIVPDTTIPVPQCNHNIHDAPHMKAACDPNNTPRPYHPSATTPTPTGGSTRSSPRYTTTSSSTTTIRSPTGGSTRTSPRYTTTSSSTTTTWSSKGGMTPAPPSYTATSRFPTRRPPGTGKTCELNTMNACGSHEACLGGPGKAKGVCECLQKYTYNTMSKKCVLKENVPSDAPFITPNPTPAAAPPGKGLSKQSMIIIGCSIGGVLILGALVVVVIFKYRRYRSRFANHMRLLQTEDNDNDDVDT